MTASPAPRLGEAGTTRATLWGLLCFLMMAGWLTPGVLAEYVRHYEKDGFAAPLAHYRCRDLSWDLTAAWTGQTINQPSLFIGGAADPALQFLQPLYETLERTYPGLVAKTLLDGIGHSAPEEAPDLVSSHLINFLKSMGTG